MNTVMRMNKGIKLRKTPKVSVFAGYDHDGDE